MNNRDETIQKLIKHVDESRTIIETMIHDNYSGKDAEKMQNNIGIITKRDSQFASKIADWLYDGDMQELLQKNKKYYAEEYVKK